MVVRALILMLWFFTSADAHAYECKLKGESRKFELVLEGCNHCFDEFDAIQSDSLIEVVFISPGYILDYSVFLYHTRKGVS